MPGPPPPPPGFKWTYDFVTGNPTLTRTGSNPPEDEGVRVKKRKPVPQPGNNDWTGPGNSGGPGEVLSPYPYTGPGGGPGSGGPGTPGGPGGGGPGGPNRPNGPGSPGGPGSPPNGPGSGPPGSPGGPNAPGGPKGPGGGEPGSPGGGGPPDDGYGPDDGSDPWRRRAPPPPVGGGSPSSGVFASGKGGAGPGVGWNVVGPEALNPNLGQGRPRPSMTALMNLGQVY